MVKKFILICLTCCFLYINATPVFASAIVITVAEQATVQGPVIVLGDLAQIIGDDQERIQKLRQVKIGSAPAPGSSFSLTSQLLVMRLGSIVNEQGIVWNIPASVTVTTGSQVVAAKTIADTASAVIKRAIGSKVNEADISIALLTPLQDVILPLGSVTISVDLPYGIRYSTPTIARVNISIDDKPTSQFNTSFAIKHYQSVVVAAKPINGRQILQLADLRYERMDISRLGPGYFTDINKVAGLMVRRSLTVGTIVNDNSLEKPVVVKSGSTVNLIARVGDIEVRAIGRALQNGAEGAVIRVQNINSKKIVSARVLDDAAVQVLTLNGG
ncbi:flagellar basal body P-ring formation protein FlgA [bacterium BFN5]|nr:flagellar basal body P-ring formation protein FlgA [bacterium BFN5]QJW46005.1 flagellar basal body P-ring formation protein FlgA [bacterium BFN5]